MRLEPYDPSDRRAVERFLQHPLAGHLYLESQLDTARPDNAFVARKDGEIRGFALFGTGQNLLFRGEDPEFLRPLAETAASRRGTWIMLVGPWEPVSAFLEAYLPIAGRRPRLDRTQGFFTLDRESLSPLAEPGLVLATEADTEELAAAAARMSAEDFEIDVWRIDRAAVRRGMVRKIREGRAWLYREDGELAFKAEIAARGRAGVQIEGVFTAESRRGRGIASRCMAELARRLLPEHPLLTLHASLRNHAALRAYESAGFRRRTEFRLVIF